MPQNIKASIATVKIGHLSLQGLLGSDGKFYVAIPQLASLNLVPPNRSQKQLEALLGKRFPTHGMKAKTELNSKAVNILTIEQAEALIKVRGLQPSSM